MDMHTGEEEEVEVGSPGKSPPTHPPTHPLPYRAQHLIRTASFSSTHPPTHPPKQPLPPPPNKPVAWLA